MLRHCFSVGLWPLLMVGIVSVGQASPAKVARELKAKREALPGAHQEFDVTQKTMLGRGEERSAKLRLTVDLAGSKWREANAGGWGSRVRIFNGTEMLTLEEGGGEYVRTKWKAKQESPLPSPYSVGLDWQNANEVERRPCAIAGRGDECVVMEAPMTPWVKDNGPTQRRMRAGTCRLMLDLANGLILSMRTVEAIEMPGSGYHLDMTYTLTRLNDRDTPTASLFAPADGMREVKELTEWDAARIKKELGGRPAPELTVTDMAGKRVTLSSYRGKTVLLDFWTTWCPPCRADAPSLDKLFQKYGGRDLVIVGISVSEERKVVEAFLKTHPHEFPMVLTTENEMPRPYQVGVFPTYLVIDREGNLAAAVDGEQGFGELRRTLKKAGLDLE